MSDNMFNEKQKYCDVQFICDDPNDASGKSTIGAHKSILSMASDVFEAMFYGPCTKKAKMDVEIENSVEIKDINIKIFKMMLSFIYSLEIKFENAEEGCNFYYAVHKYNIKEGIKFISAYLSKNLSPENAIFVYESTLPYEDKQLEYSFYNILAQKANQIISSKSFLNANLSTVEIIFKLEKLHIKSEIELVNALKRYVDEFSKNDQDITAKIRPALKSIRFLTLSPEILCKYIHDTGLLTAEEIVCIIASLPPQKDFSKLPEGFSQITTNRKFHQKGRMVRLLSEVFSSKICNACVPYKRESNHALWTCPLANSNKEAIRTIYQKYNHVSLMEYNNGDIMALYKAYVEMGFIIEPSKVFRIIDLQGRLVFEPVE